MRSEGDAGRRPRLRLKRHARRERTVAEAREPPGRLLAEAQQHAERTLDSWWLGPRQRVPKHRAARTMGPRQGTRGRGEISRVACRRGGGHARGHRGVTQPARAVGLAAKTPERLCAMCGLAHGGGLTAATRSSEPRGYSACSKRRGRSAAAMPRRRSRRAGVIPPSELTARALASARPGFLTIEHVTIQRAGARRHRG